jgi:hypothetical protein
VSIDYTLGVTSPLTTGEDVGRAQFILNGHNEFKKDWHRGQIDHVFGEETGRSCIRAKYWTGYPDKDLKPTYGPALDAILLGEKPLTAEMTKRIAARMKQAQSRPLREKALERLEGEIGYHETGQNNNKFGKWYGMNFQPYCAMAVTWAYVLEGSKAFVKGSRYAYCPYIVNDARAGRYGLSVTKDPLPGDLVLYNWDGDWDADHVGLFKRWLKKGVRFTAVEANTSPDDSGNQSNGGGVYLRGEAPGVGDTRKAVTVQCFVRVGR